MLHADGLFSRLLASCFRFLLLLRRIRHIRHCRHYDDTRDTEATLLTRHRYAIISRHAIIAIATR